MLVLLGEHKVYFKRKKSHRRCSKRFVLVFVPMFGDIARQIMVSFRHGSLKWRLYGMARD